MDHWKIKRDYPKLTDWNNLKGQVRGQAAYDQSSEPTLKINGVCPLKTNPQLAIDDIYISNISLDLYTHLWVSE